MGVVIRVGHEDHKTVEDFLAGDTVGVTGVTLDPRWRGYQQGVVSAATDAGIDVLVDPMTDRLTVPGLSSATLPYAGTTGAIDLDRLERDRSARDQLVEQVVEVHPDGATALTAPHFYVHDQRSAGLGLALLEQLVAAGDSRPARAVVVLATQYPLEAVGEIAEAMAQLAVRRVEVRLSPFGGEDLSARQIRRGLDRYRAFTDAGLSVTAGWAGLVGQTALARGVVDHYSVGVAERERLDHKAALNTQQKPPRVDENGKRLPQGSKTRIYLPGLMLSTPAATGELLIADTAVRTRVGCRIGRCGSSINGPMLDPRQHYLHSHATYAAGLAGQPTTWQTHGHNQQLHRALTLRELVNARHLPADVRKLPTRTITSLLAEVTGAQDSQIA